MMLTDYLLNTFGGERVVYVRPGSRFQQERMLLVMWSSVI